MEAGPSAPSVIGALVAIRGAQAERACRCLRAGCPTQGASRRSPRWHRARRRVRVGSSCRWPSARRSGGSRARSRTGGQPCRRSGGPGSTSSRVRRRPSSEAGRPGGRRADRYQARRVVGVVERARTAVFSAPAASHRTWVHSAVNSPTWAARSASEKSGQVGTGASSGAATNAAAIRRVSLLDPRARSPRTPSRQPASRRAHAPVAPGDPGAPGPPLVTAGRTSARGHEDGVDDVDGAVRRLDVAAHDGRLTVDLDGVAVSARSRRRR